MDSVYNLICDVLWSWCLHEVVIKWQKKSLSSATVQIAQSSKRVQKYRTFVCFKRQNLELIVWTQHLDTTDVFTADCNLKTTISKAFPWKTTEQQDSLFLFCNNPHFQFLIILLFYTVLKQKIMWHIHIFSKGFFASLISTRIKQWKAWSWIHPCWNSQGIGRLGPI